MSNMNGTVAANGKMTGSLQAILGKDGYSAYELAVKNGFEGTETEWLASLKSESNYVTPDGTVVSQNADFAEVAEWADGNPNNEDRTGYFVCANVPVNGIVMKKATSTDDVKGVSILAPAFAGNYSKDKVDSNGNLLPKYSYVAIIGFVPVRDNGTCEVGGRCMPDDNGCAIPSSNSMGYQVINRIDDNRVLIIIEPNGDMVQRVKTKINALQENVENIKDKTFWKVISSGEVDANSGGAPKITAELKENIADFREFRFYLEIPTGSPTGTSTTMYVNAVIDSANPAIKNCLMSTAHSGTPSVGKTTRTIAIMNVVTSPDGTRYIQSVSNQVTINQGINTRGNPLSSLCLWDVSDSSKNLTINISNYNFESGTKWILEGR